MSKIIIIEDDIYLREELINTFERKGYSVGSISSFDAPEKEILEFEPDLAILDINLPNKSGFELCKWLKARASFPILILTSRDALADELHALGLGADDFLTKPCNPSRLVARVERLLQNYGKVKSMIQVGEYVLDTDTFKLIYQNSHIILSETEGKLLKVLMESYPKLVTKEEIFRELWGTEEFVDENILQVNMTRLRRSLNDIESSSIIKTVRGRGYQIEVHEDEK